MSAPPPILFRDERFVVLDKPAGLPVHPGRQAMASVEDWFPLLSRRKTGPWLAHRLDTDTSGCLVVALRRTALLAAQAAFAAGTAQKTYWAVVSGHPTADSGMIDAPLLRSNTSAGWCMRVDRSGQSAVTVWQVRGRSDAFAWLELHPRTGRTHQIRVHCRALGCPVVGDPVYGADEERTRPGRGNATALHLLARSIRLPLNPPLEACAEPGSHMVERVRQCGWTG